MREIDPQSGDLKSDARLSEALRGLAASSNRGAPAEIGAGLATAFRRHHTRRRRIRRAGISALVLCLSVLAAVLSTRFSSHQKPGNEQGHTISSPTATKPSEAMPVTRVVPAKPQAVVKRGAARASTRKVTTQSASNRPFLALPAYDPSIPKDQMHVVRVHLPASELWQMGAPISASAGTRSMTADFVVGQGGTPYAVRLVQ